MKKLAFFVCLAAYAQPTPIPKATRMTAWEIYEAPNSKVMRQQATVGTIDIFNTTGASRVSLSSAGGLSTTVGIMEGRTGAAGAETTVWRADSTGVFTNQSLRVIDGIGDRVKLEAASSSFYNSNLAQRVFVSPAGGASSTVGIVAGYTGAAGSETIAWQANSSGFSTVASFRALTSGGNYAGFKVNPALAANVEWMLPTADAVGCLQSDGAGTLSIASCGAGSFVTLNTAQTLTAGANKDIVDSAFTWVTSGTDRVIISTAGVTMNNAAGAARVNLVSTGLVQVLTGSLGSETVAAEVIGGGVGVYTSTGAAFRVNGVPGATFTCGSGQYPTNFSATSGIAMSFGCAAVPTGGGDMLLGTAQTVTALKTFQMTFGGDAIRVNNTGGALKGRWDDLQLVVGDQAAGSGRGVAVSGASGVLVYNTSGTSVIQLGTTGNVSAISYTANGSPGLSGTCAIGLRPTFTGGIATGCI